MSHSDVTDSLTNPVSEGGQEGSATFEFDEKDGAVEDLSRATMDQTGGIDTSLEVPDSHIDQGITTALIVDYIMMYRYVHFSDIHLSLR